MNAIGAQLCDAINSGLNRLRVCKRQIQLKSVENNQADAGQDGRTRLARPNSRARAGTGEIFIFPVQVTTGKIGWQPVDQNTLPYEVRDDHTYMYIHNVQ